jgi:hypothetical protein|tara:strand:+ start:11789 stop:12016 length:228 start_codon:yes stop_codon:yes gene_type:complete
MALLGNLILLMKTEFGSFLISVIWGFALALLFRRTCKNRNCVVIKAPNAKEVEDKIYKFDSACFTFNTNVSECSA